MIDLLIKIPEKEYAAILRGEVKMSALKNWSIFNAIKNGTPLDERQMILTETEVKTIFEVFDDLNKMDYIRLNTFLGSITIKKMRELYEKIKDVFYGR